MRVGSTRSGERLDSLRDKVEVDSARTPAEDMYRLSFCVHKHSNNTLGMSILDESHKSLGPLLGGPSGIYPYIL